MFTNKVLLMITLVAAMGIISSACAPQPAPTAAPPVVQTRIVEQTKVVEKIITATPVPTVASAASGSFNVFQGTLMEKEKTSEVSTDELR